MIIAKNLLACEKTVLRLNGKAITVPVYTFPTIVVGSGAAGLNCADLLASSASADGTPRVAVVTEGLKMGTSRNTGSDKQTYYKLTLSGDTPDSVGDMAKSLFDGGATDGDLALCEAAGSVRSFLRLVNLGVPFPINDYGEFAGYQTDHDTRTRATSCGPLTSKYMTEALERSVLSRGVPIFDGHRAVQILTNQGSAVGIVTLCAAEAGVYNAYGLSLFSARNIVWATGGPSAIYAATVYPESQTCAHGAAFAAGAAAVNVTESQYGLASVKFRWNLSGTYQQVLPRYYSTAPDGSDAREFLDGWFEDLPKLLTAIFKKGYQWPFDPAKLITEGESGRLRGSSLVDLAVYRECHSGRRVYLDFTRNPSAAALADGSLDFTLLEDEPHGYLEKSGALLARPIDRLAKMNAPAIDLYRCHGIDLATEPLEIAVCAQHNNGGFEVDTAYESTTLAHFFVVGEAAGVFGIHRPGGSALNSTQVSSLRAADKITSDAGYSAPPEAQDIAALALSQTTLLALLGQMAETGLSRAEILAKRQIYAERMTACGAFLRIQPKITAAIAEIRSELEVFATYQTDSPSLLTELSINRDILITQLVYLSAIWHYIGDGGKSRGSYLICDSADPVFTRPVELDTAHRNQIGRVCYRDGEVDFSWRDVHPIPERDNWFENVYNAYRTKYRL